MLSLCHSSAIVPSDAMLDASMRAIFDGILALEAEKSKLADLGINVNPFTGDNSALIVPYSRSGAGTPRQHAPDCALKGMCMSLCAQSGGKHTV